MFIKFKCGKCQKVYKVDSKNAGRKTKCVGCQSVLVIPKPASPVTEQTSSHVARVSNAAANPAAPTQAQTPSQASQQPIAPQPTAPQPAPVQPSLQQRSSVGPDLQMQPAPSPTADPWIQQDSGAPAAPTPSGELFDALPAFESVQSPVVVPNPGDTTNQIFNDALAGEGLNQTAALDLPSLGAPHRVAANPGDVNDPFAGLPPTVAASPQSAPTEDWAGVFGSLEQTVATAVAAEQQRKLAKMTVQEVVRAFAQDMPPVEKKSSFGSKLSGVAAMMLVLPTLFTLFVGFASAALVVVFYRWITGPEVSMPHPLIGLGFALLCFLVLSAWIPVFIMLGSLLSMLIHGGKEHAANMQLTRENQPVMYEFVDQICSKVGAPKPTRIDLDCDINASASFRAGWMSFGKQDLVLTIGIPLIASQNTEQLASVIAHEFGHFRQGSAMRASFLVRGLTHWFMERAIIGAIRAEMNAQEIADSEISESPFFGILFGFLYVVGFVGRQMMWYFALACHAVSGSLSREMEYDADRLAVHLAGSKAFIQSSANLERYSAAYRIMIENLKGLFQHGVFIDNVPRFMMHIGRTLPADEIRTMADEIEKEKQESYDTHPPTRDRNAEATRLAQPGVLNLNRPSTDLIDHWKQLCERSTLDFYTEKTGLQIESKHVTPLEDVLKEEHKLLIQK